MDSSGIAIVISCVRRMRQLRGEVILRSVPPQPMKVLKASGIERIATLEGLAAVKSYAANFKEQVKSLLAQRVENYKSDVESLTGTAPLELADNGDHFSYPGVIDGERDELPL